MNASSASESFFVPEERKPTPIETSKPMPFDEKPIAAPSPQRIQHGRAFPPPVSRVGSPMSGKSSAYGLPASPRSGRIALTPRISQEQRAEQREEQRAEHTPTPEMREMWLRHQRSTSSVDSSTALLRAGSSRISHSRNTSRASMSSENIHTILGRPILPNGEITRRVDADIMSIASRSQTASPAPAINVIAPSSPGSEGLPPPPRPRRGDGIRESILSINKKLGEVTPPMTPIPSEHSSGSKYSSPTRVPVGLPLDSDHREEGQVKANYGPGTPKTSVASNPASRAHSTRTSMSYEHEDFEIHRVDSRDRLKPAISAVARAPTATPSDNTRQRSQNKNEMAMSSTVSLPESVGGVSMHTGESEDTMLEEIRSRSESLENAEGALSSIAWASLVAHAAVQERLAASI